MFVYSLKLGRKKLKLLGLCLVFALLIGTAAGVLPAFSKNQVPLEVIASGEKNVKFDGIKTDEDLQNFINSLGIEVKTPAYNSVDIELPRVFDAVYKKYNDIQKQQGFDLSKYKGKTLHRYTFEVTNYPIPESTPETNGKIYLTLFKYKDKIVGGDISSRDFGGFVKTFLDFSLDNEQ